MTTNYDTTRLLHIIVAITYDNNVRVIPSRDALQHQYNANNTILSICNMFINDSPINNNRN